ncbi:hypothetical protein SAMN05443287_105127 [Micromonospora phaseoli]|uniref:Uncharacterized protein n=1 Tax=Micromonospora phaseoli TaxID=1144548 RepID=A0A1H6ZKV7_9ACTN|nr:hypothetical protein [Micromonospora phaseoli]PZV97177.1 hypothetical protein CLV64_106286 [Micromonospora phaseoli]GIJ77243.1 hypothetical protein Xph01_16750 [Micromonospora phaseoli]SEJ53326.1 hypothetical protein SAMN05443287_105127 [Micromonospora phaseoli]
MATVTFVDESTAGARTPGWALQIFEERLTLRELIRRRIHQEVAEHNAANAGPRRLLVQPSPTERALNGDPAQRTARRVDPERQFALAEEAFGRNGFVVLVGDRQVEELDDEVDLRRDTEVTFLKLVALVGG